MTILNGAAMVPGGGEMALESEPESHGKGPRKELRKRRNSPLDISP
jgi:hypothetical protein